MVRKVYAYPGMANIIVPVPCGRATINVTFKDGCLDKKQSRPATYSTGDPVMQAIIENSPQFGHRIFLRDTFDIPGTPEVKKAAKASIPSVSIPAEDPAPAEGVSEPETTEDSTAASFPDVTTFEEAVGILKGIPGVKVANLRTPASAKKVAALNGVVFPNYNFD